MAVRLKYPSTRHRSTLKYDRKSRPQAKKNLLLRTTCLKLWSRHCPDEVASELSVKFQLTRPPLDAPLWRQITWDNIMVDFLSKKKLTSLHRPIGTIINKAIRAKHETVNPKMLLVLCIGLGHRTLTSCQCFSQFWTFVANAKETTWNVNDNF